MLIDMNDSASNPPGPWTAIVEDARRYPSPHNSQPIKLRPTGTLTARLFYDLDLGLPAESFGIPFAHVCAGVFLESLRVVARAAGYGVAETLDHSQMDFDGGDRMHRFADVELRPLDLTAEERVEAGAALERFRTRRTSRRPYASGSVPEAVLDRVRETCAEAGYEFRNTSEPALVRRIVHVNQATLFDDLEHDAVYGEIMEWLRFSKREAAARADGLSAEAMLLPGPILRYAMGHRGLWKAPLIGAAIRGVYLNTMRGVHELGWIEGPFAGPADHIEAGRTFMRVWLQLHRDGVVLHPFGTVITNPRSHALFADAVGAREGEGRMAWMLFRFGYSGYPPARASQTGRGHAARGGRTMRRLLTFGFLAVLEAVVRLFMPRVGTHRLLLAPGIEPLRWKLGRLRAWRTFERTARRVPAYRAFLAERRFPRRLDASDVEGSIRIIPEMDKESYIKRWPIPERCISGRIPRRGVIVDESSGSSGTPTSWVRGPRERQATRQILQLGYSNTAASLRRPPFVLNAFSLGAWATGMNVTTSLTDVSMIKSIGPDKNKIIQTMREFGPNYTYVILSYPPFLKALFDDPRLDWEQYDIVAAFGGEGISESMRDHILKVAHAAYGSYGASDLEINLALETDLTVELRRAIDAHPELAARISKRAEYGVLPMIFQFNPFNYLIETNGAGELLVTIARAENLNPRIRYNIHDRGHVMRLRELEPILRELGLSRILRAKQLDLPLLFHYGRSDLSVDFNGAVIGPDSLRDVVNANELLLGLVENHRLISYEDERGDRQLHLAIQLIDGRDPAELDASAVAARIFAELRRANGDFHNAILTSDDAALPTLAFYRFREGPFHGDGAKLKNEYVAHLDAEATRAAALDLSISAEKRPPG